MNRLTDTNSCLGAMYDGNSLADNGIKMPHDSSMISTSVGHAVS